MGGWIVASPRATFARNPVIDEGRCRDGNALVAGRLKSCLTNSGRRGSPAILDHPHDLVNHDKEESSQTSYGKIDPVDRDNLVDPEPCH